MIGYRSSCLALLLTRSRPRFWFYLAGPVLVGAAFGASTVPDLFDPWLWALFGYFLIPANLYLYGINDVFDASIDRSNPKKHGPERRFTGDQVTVVSSVISGVLGLGLVIGLPAESAIWVLGFLVLGAAYSAPPLRFKTTPFLDSLSNGLYILPAGAAYMLLAGSIPPLAAVVGGWLWAMAMHTYSAIPDIEPDRTAGIRTTATVLGHRTTLWYCGVCWALAAVGFGVLDVRAGLLLAVYPVFLGLTSLSQLPATRTYWWFPAINVIVGAILTLGGLRRVIYG